MARRILLHNARKRVAVALVALLFVILLLSTAYLAIHDYPRIVRNAYYRNPAYVIKAAWAEYVVPKNVSRNAALERVRGTGLMPTGNPQFLCLLNEPDATIGKPVIDRYFGLLSKAGIDTSETSFWEIPVATGIGYAFVEVSTGRVIYLDGEVHGTTYPRYYPARQ